MTGTRYQNCMARMFVSESDTIQYSRKAKRRPEVMQWFSRYFCGNYWLEKGEAADWLFACILRKIDVWTATWSQCWSMLDSLNKCYGQWVRILASMAGRNFLDTGPQQSIENDIISIFQMETFSTSEICLNCCSKFVAEGHIARTNVSCNYKTKLQLQRVSCSYKSKLQLQEFVAD